MKIRITIIPPGFAPEGIRRQWIGVEIPVAAEDRPGTWLGNGNSDGYIVWTHEAVTALEQAGKPEAATFWKRTMSFQLRFDKSVCEIVD